MGVKRARQRGQFQQLLGCVVSFVAKRGESATPQGNTGACSSESAVRGMALYERDHGKDIGVLLYVLHEDGLVRAWAASEMDEIATVVEKSKLKPKQTKLREAERAYYMGSVKGRRAYYAGHLTKGTGLEVWNELDHAWCRCTVESCPAYFDCKSKAYNSVKKPVATVIYSGPEGKQLQGTIGLDDEVWRLAGEKPEVEQRMRDHRCLLVLPEVGVSVTRPFASPNVTLTVQMDVGGLMPVVNVNEWTATIEQRLADSTGKSKLKRVIVQLPIRYNGAGNVDASFDDKGVLKVLYMAKRHETMS
jgi:hypothetical protein